VHQGLSPEANGKPDNAGAGQQRSHVDPEDGKNLEQGQEHQHENARAVGDSAQGAQLLGAQAGGQALGFAQGAQAVRQRLQQAEEHKRHHDNDQELGNVHADEIQGVGAPVLDQLPDSLDGGLGHACKCAIIAAEHAAFLAGRGSSYNRGIPGSMRSL
jgi:hypothetical protein